MPVRRSAGSTTGGTIRTLASQERRFALALLLPALLVLLLATTTPLVYLVWNSLHRLDLGMPWLSGFAGLENYVRMGGDPRFWNSLWLTVVYTGSTVILQVLIGLSLELVMARSFEKQLSRIVSRSNTISKSKKRDFR